MPRRAKRFIPKAVKEPGFTLTSRPLGLAAGTIGYFVCAAALHLSFPKRAVAYRQRLCRLRLSQSYFARRQARRYVSAFSATPLRRSIDRSPLQAEAKMI